MSKSKLYARLAALTGFFAFAACQVPQAKQGGQHGGDGSVLAAIGGVSETDMSRPGVGFWLVCDSGTKVKGEAKKEVDGKEYVRFAGGSFGASEKCGMEIRDASVAGDSTYEWFGVENGQKAKGLLYGSSKDVVKNKALSLKLYKLYAIKLPNVDTFTVTTAITLELASNGAMPEADKAAASLVCSATEKFPGTYKRAAAGNDATLTFPALKVADMKGKKCERLVVLVDNKEAFSGEALGLELKDPKKNDDLKFPGENKRYTLKVVVTGDVDVNTEGADCISYVDGDCRDRTEVTMPAGKTIAVAKVEGKLENGKGAVKSYYVAMGDVGLMAFEGEKLAVDMLNANLKKDATDAEKKRFHWYAEAANDALAAALDKKLASGETLTAHAVKREDLADFKVLHIAEVKAHGFHKIDAGDLNTKPKASWLAWVKATKDAKTVEFVVSGKEKFFAAAAPQATVGTDKVYFDYKTLATEMASATGSDKWRAYAFKGGAMAQAECGAEKAFYTAGLSLLNTDELKPDAAVAQTLDKCEIAKAQWDATIADFKEDVIFYELGWYAIAK